MASEYRVLAGLTVDVTGEGTGYKFPLHYSRKKLCILRLYPGHDWVLMSLFFFNFMHFIHDHTCIHSYIRAPIIHPYIHTWYLHTYTHKYTHESFSHSYFFIYLFKQKRIISLSQYKNQDIVTQNQFWSGYVSRGARLVIHSAHTSKSGHILAII